MKKMKMNQGKASSRGFTLIEVAIVIAIIGILVAIAIPSYDKYMKKVTRKKMTAKMQEVALLLEKNYAICSRYNVNCTTRQPFVPGLGDIISPFDEPVYPNDGRAWSYQMTVQLQPHNFTIIAVPTPGSQQTTDNCNQLGLDSRGIQYAGADAAGFGAPNINNDFNCWN